MPRFAASTAPVEADLSTAILSAPGWAKVGITAPNERLRRAAADELARFIVEGTLPELDRNQLAFSL